MDGTKSEGPPNKQPITRRELLKAIKVLGPAAALVACNVNPDDFDPSIDYVKNSDVKETVTVFENNPQAYKNKLYELLLSNRDVLLQSVELSFTGQRSAEEEVFNTDGYIIYENDFLGVIATTKHEIEEMQLNLVEITQPHLEKLNIKSMKHLLNPDDPMFRTGKMHIAYYPDTDLALIYFLKDPLLDGDEDYLAQFQTEFPENDTDVVGMSNIPSVGNENFSAFPIEGTVYNKDELIIYAASLPGASGAAVVVKETKKIIGLVHGKGDLYGHTIKLTRIPPKNDFENFINEHAKKFLEKVELDNLYTPITLNDY